MKMIKKITISAIVLVLAFFFAFSAKVNAEDVNTSEYITVVGAGIRTTGNAGLRFEVSVDTTQYTASIKEYHVLIAYGKVTDVSSIVLDETVNGKTLLDGKDGTGLVDGKYYVTVYGIPTDQYETYVTARAYVVLDDASSTVVYSLEACYRNVYEIAKAAYAASDTYDEGTNLVKTVAEATKLTVTTAAGSVTHVEDFGDVSLSGGETLTLAKGTYNDTLTINKSNINVFGPFAGVKVSSDTRVEHKEAVIKKAIVIANNVSDIIISGVTINASNALKLTDSQSNITLKYSIIEYSGNSGIYDSDDSLEFTTMNHKNINILKNKITGTDSTKNNKSINLQGYVENINVEGNTFISSGKAINSNEYCIRMNLVKPDSYINIMQNVFNQKSATYLVDIGYSHDDNNKIDAYMNIEDNEGLGSGSGNEFLGNGFRITHVGTDSTINFIHNEKMRFSRYYNTILFSEKDCTGSSGLGTTTENPTIVIKYNKLYGDYDKKVENPGRSTTLNTNYLNLGLGFSKSSPNITITQNYFSGTARGYSFTYNTSSASSKNVYAAGAITNATSVSVYTECDTLYSNDTTIKNIAEYLSDIKTYNEYAEDLADSVNAWAGGSNANNIDTYIPDFSTSAYASKYEIQNGKLVYVGTDFIEKMTSARISIYSGSSIKPAS